MLSSIHPLGERGRKQRWWLTVTTYVVASTAAGTAIGTLAGAAGGLVPDGWRRPAAIAVATIALGLEIGRVPVLTMQRQVDEDWLTSFRGWVYGGGFGAQLGFGVATTVTTWAVYATVALAALTGDIAAGAGLGMAFGAARAAMLARGRHIDTPSALVSFHRRLQREARVAHSGVVVTTMLVAATAAVAVL